LLAPRFHLDTIWSTWFEPRSGGTIVIVGFGTFGAREVLRMVNTFVAAEASREILAVLLLDFHQEVLEYASLARRLLGKRRVLSPRKLPPGTGQGFMHKIKH